MRRAYEAPSLEVELYQLDANIASNCAYVVNMGPDGPGAVKVCDAYYELTGETKPVSASVVGGSSLLSYNIDFWTEASCDCYYTASGVFFTS